MGHVQLIHLPPCPPPRTRGPPPSGPPPKPPPPPSKHPVSIIIAHNTALTTLSLPPSGRLLATTSSRGTLVRIWDTLSGHRVHEFRRGTDKAVIYGVAFRPDEAELCVWSDKGTVHIFTLAGSHTSNRQSSISQLAPYLPIPKYFESEWSYAQYRIPMQSSHISLTSTTRSPTEDVPDEERCVVGWVRIPVDNTPDAATEYQLIALTYVGGWYRLALPNATSSSASTEGGKLAKSPLPQHMSSRSSVATSSKQPRSSKRKEKEREKDSKASQCTLQEYRRFGRWDGWG
ncbi:hypothetical protein L218DRAFT_959065 [Marasmius fiardii PR-910]|nr:hypothetical protein L218DRAFT_959065 [Marasmius fiardii PR-910]